MSDDTVECEECSAQWGSTETDSGHCPDCGGECFELEAIYGDEEEGESA